MSIQSKSCHKPPSFSVSGSSGTIYATSSNTAGVVLNANNNIWNSGIAYSNDYYPNWNTWYYPSFPATTVTITPIQQYVIENYMKTTFKQEDDRIILTAELAGFKKEEVKVKYFNPDCNEGKAYIEIIAESKTHQLKNESDKTYKLTQKQYLDAVKKLNYTTAQTSFVDGLLSITVEFEETSKIKELTIG